MSFQAPNFLWLAKMIKKIKKKKERYKKGKGIFHRNSGMLEDRNKLLLFKFSTSFHLFYMNYNH